MKYLLNICLMLFLLLMPVACAAQPSPTEQSSPSDPILQFFADRNSVAPGACTELTWEVQPDYVVTINGETVKNQGQMGICPAATSAYEMIASKDGPQFQRIIEVMVEGAPAVETQASTAPGAPAYQSSSWVRLGGPPGGLGYDIRMQPDNPDIMYVTDANAGIHKSVDGGVTWLPINEGIAPFGAQIYPVFCVTIDPHDFNRVWVGTQFTGQIYLSLDAGNTWEERDVGISFEGYSVRGLTIDPTDPNVVYAAVEVSSTTWNKSQIVKRFDLTKGEVYKSVDQGMNWKRIWVGDNLARYIWIDPGNSNRVYVSTGIFDRDAANSDIPNGVWGGVGILRSDNAGQTWTVLDEQNGLGGRYIPSLFMHPQDSQTLLSAVTGSGDAPGVYVTHDGGDTWKLILGMPPGFGAEAVEIATSDPDIWYAASESLIWRSDNAGADWQEFPMVTPDRAAGIPIDLQVDPRDPMRIFVNNYGGGNFVSADGGATWHEASTGYTGSKPNAVAVNPADSARVIVSAFYSADAGQTWRSVKTPVFSSLQYYTDQDSGTLSVIGGSGERIWFSPAENYKWEFAQLADLAAEKQTGNILNERMVIDALAVAPSDNSMMYAAFADGYCALHAWLSCFDPTPGFFRSRDYGRTWQPVTEPAFRQTSTLRIAVDPLDSQHLYAATGTGLFVSRDGALTWTQLTSLDAVTRQVPVIDVGLVPVDLKASMVFDIRIDPFDADVLYAASMPGGVFKSTDQGQTWVQSGFGMDPNEPVTAIVPDPVHQGVLYVSSEISGLFYSTDDGENWKLLSQGLTIRNLFTLSLSADGSLLYAASVGAGVFRLGDHPR